MVNLFINKHFYRLFILFLWFYGIKNTLFVEVSNSKEDVNRVIVEQLKETINWDNPEFYAEAKQNLARAKEIKKDGIKQPIIIAPLKNEHQSQYKYYTLSGRHRLFAINNDPYLKCKYKYIYCAVVLDDSFNK